MVCWLVINCGMDWEQAGNTTFPQYRMLTEHVAAMHKER
jgi:hypothetical protein